MGSETTGKRDEYGIAADLLEDHGFDAPAKLLRQLGSTKRIIGISGGEYSEYSVRAIVEDEATAKAWCDAINADENDDTKCYSKLSAEEFTFIAAGTKPHQVVAYTQNVELWDDGRIEQQEIHEHREWLVTAYYGPPPERPAVRYVRAPCHGGVGGRLEVRGKSEADVAKVVGEKIAMWKAGAWGGPSVGNREINE